LKALLSFILDEVVFLFYVYGCSK